MLPVRPRAPGESRLPKLPKLARKANLELDHVEMAPSRLARISRKTPLDQLSDGGSDDGESGSAPDPVADHESATVEAMLESMVAEVEQRTCDADARGPDEGESIGEAEIEDAGIEEAGIDEPGAEAVALRLVPQIPPRDAISTSSWLGGRPRLPGGMEWPKIGGEPADFLAQIDCAGLSPDLWGGRGPRDGALAFFIHPRNPDVRVFHLRDTDVAVAPPLMLDDRDGWFAPYGGIGFGDLAAFAVRAFSRMARRPCRRGARR